MLFVRSKTYPDLCLTVRVCFGYTSTYQTKPLLLINQYVRLFVLLILNPKKLLLRAKQMPRLPTVLRFYGSTVLRFYGSTVLRFYGSTVLRFYGSTVLRFYGSTVLRFYGSTVLRFYGSTVLRFYLNVYLRFYCST